MSEMMTVREYNERGRAKHSEAVAEWKKQIGTSTPFPFLPKYLFTDDNGEELTEGYVVLGKIDALYFRTLEEASEYMACPN